jgi:general secretion pathway protein D
MLALTLAGPGRAQSNATPVTLNFVNAEIDAVARAMSSMTGRQVVVDPRVKGTLNLSSDKPLSATAAYNQFLAALRLQGFTVVESAGLDKVVPEAEAKLQSGTVNAGSGGVASNQIVTQIFKLNFENANNLLPVLRPLITPNNVINVNAGNNSLVITDYADNLQRIARIIAASDVSNASDIEIIPLKYAVASDLAALVLRLVDTGGTPIAAAGQADGTFKTTVIAEPRSNALIVRAANRARVALVKSLVDRLDQPSVQGDGGTGNIHVVYLKNADATKLAATLHGVLTGESHASTNSSALSPTLSGSATATTGSTQATGSSMGSSMGSGSAAASQGGQIQADVPTNSLIITAPDPQYRQLRAVIDQLDGRRAQVYIESLIAEVNANRAAQFGIQWQGPVGSAGNGTIGLLGTNFGTGGSNIIGLSAGAVAGAVPSAGLNIGAATLTNGVYSLSLLANFLETNGDGNILSTPNLLTLDNEEAKIVVGQNVPFLTGQYSNSGTSSTGTVNPFQTIERKDVGITLKVRPQISENGTVRLAIFQEVSSVDPTSVSSTAGLITNKRSIESNVIVDDGAIVVLGGLLSDTYSSTTNRVPGLADLPIFGNLFKSDSRSRQKTNLMVFLRPVVLRDGASTAALARSHYEQMRGVQEGEQPQPSVLMPINASVVLPELPPVPAAKTPVPAPVPAKP